MENAASIEKTLGGGLHGHLGLVITPARHLQLTGNPFAPPPNSGPTSVMPNPFMMAVDAETICQNHIAQLAIYHKFLNTDKALKNQLLCVVDDQYIKALKQGMIRLNARLEAAPIQMCNSLTWLMTPSLKQQYTIMTAKSGF
eukprot:15362138-Ditylum_brightwellii.AAC.1